jgi:RNA polymerase sigma-70 factor (ECF subfamily)
MEELPDERQLALRARAGDRVALEALVRRFRLWLFAIAYGELRHNDDAHDAVAAALVRICAHIHGLEDAGKLRSWMAAITRNEAHRVSRRSARAAPHLRDASDERWDETATLRADVERALRILPAQEAAAIRAFHLNGDSIHEIALQSGRPQGTVKSWLYQGRRRLAREMEEYAPMKRRWNAAIVSDTLGSTEVADMTAALTAAGWSAVDLVEAPAWPAAPESHSGGARFHLPDTLRDHRYILLDEWIGGRSAFELLTLFNATVERKEVAIGLLVATAPESLAYAAWLSGVDALFTKPLDSRLFQDCASHLRQQVQRSR